MEKEYLLNIIKTIGSNTTTKISNDENNLNVFANIPNSFYEQQCLIKQANYSNNKGLNTVLLNNNSSALPISMQTDFLTYKTLCFCKFISRFLKVNDERKPNKYANLAVNEMYLYDRIVSMLLTDDLQNDGLRNLINSFNISLPFESVLEYKYAKEFAREYDGEQRFKLIKGVYKMFKIKKTTAENVK